MNSSQVSVLLFSEDTQRSRESAKRLITGGIAAVTARNKDHAISLLESKPFDWIVLDLGENLSKCVDLMLWAKSRISNIRVMALWDRITDHKLEKRLFRLGADIVAQGDIPIEALTLLEDHDDEESFSGRIEGVDILDYLQFLMLSNRTTIVEISSKKGERGKIYVKNGDVVHSTFLASKGEEALYHCLKMRGGRFENAPWKEPHKTTINKPGELLLFEAARIRDEEREPDKVARA
jgi:CheY-like chemotaxis protein